MKSILACVTLLMFAACSQTTQIPTDAPAVNCAQPQKPNQEPIEGGIGGTGALPEEDCRPSATN
ncbi:MAG: hypothetical protein GY742_08910 [Hyphomicrobiales bacterium]|nr:hypothetical protein [Hyphomicrobiales bacterium]